MLRLIAPRVLGLTFALTVSACGGAVDAPESSASAGCDPGAPPARTVSCVESFTPGEGAGYGMEALPEVLFGEPHGGGLKDGGLDVLSLGKGGEITVGFGGNSIVDGDGPDFIVFENAFYVGGDPMKPFKELGEVSASEDGNDFVPFPCAKAAYPYEGCAGWRAVLAGTDPDISSFDPEAAGGESFDLAEIGLSSARFVRIRDISSYGAEPNAGFDLDALTVVNAAHP